MIKGIKEAAHPVVAPCIILTHELLILEFNAAAEKVFGWPSQFVINKNFSSICQSRHIAFPWPDMEQINTSPEGVLLGLLEIDNLLGDMHVIAWNMKWVAHYGDLHNVIMLTGTDVTTDAHAKKSQSSLIALDSLIQSEHVKSYSVLSSIIDYLPGSVYMKENNGNYIACNEYLEKNIGGLSSRRELIGISDWQLSEAMGDRWDDNLVRSIITDDTKVLVNGMRLIDKVEDPFLDVDGQLVYQSSTKIPMQDDNGETIGLFGISIDISAYLPIVRLRQMYKDVYHNTKSGHIAFMKHFLGPGAEGYDVVTTREFDCLYQLAQGRTMKEIALILKISARTVESHIDNMREKMQYEARSQLISFFQDKVNVIHKAKA